VTPFCKRIDSVVTDGGFAMKDWWVWCGSVAADANGRYHMFAARWPQALNFLPAYQSYSEIVRAESDRPEGPYRFRDVVLGDRGPAFWDGRMTHNPAVVRWRDRWLLFYIGTTFEGPKPTAAALAEGPMMYPWYRDIRIGAASATTLAGPWSRPEKPLLLARPGMWDEHVVTNPSPCVTSDGRLLLYYRSYIRGRGCRLGLAIYDDPDAEPVWRSDKPLFDDEGTAFEDPFVFEIDGHFEMIAKDLTGKTTGELHAAAHLVSEDGIRWRLGPEPKAYSRTLPFDDGSTRKLSNVERPALLLHDGQPTHLFAAMGEGARDVPGAFEGISRSWNGVIRLRPGGTNT
jgi:hypothetical protein